MSDQVQRCVACGDPLPRSHPYGGQMFCKRQCVKCRGPRAKPQHSSKNVCHAGYDDYSDFDPDAGSYQAIAKRALEDG